MTEQETAETAVDLLLANRDEWTIHSATLAGRDDERLYLVVVRSRVGDSGLLLSLRYFVVDPLAREGYWGSDGIEMLVNGPLHGALAKGLLSVGDMGFAGDQGDPETFDVTGAENGVVEDPADLLGSLDRLPEAEAQDSEPEGEVECISCGGSVDASEAMKLDMSGNVMYRHRGDCPDD